MTYYLVEYRANESYRQEWRIKVNSIYTVGRNPNECDIVIPHYTLSRKHLALEILETKNNDSVFDADTNNNIIVRLTDLKTVNGSFIDDVKVSGPSTFNLSEEKRLKFAQNPYYYVVKKHAGKSDSEKSNFLSGTKYVHIEKKSTRPQIECNQSCSELNKSIDVSSDKTNSSSQFVSKWDTETDSRCSKSDQTKSYSKDGHCSTKYKQEEMLHMAKSHAVRLAHNPQLSRSTGLTLEEKKKMLWGKKNDNLSSSSTHPSSSTERKSNIFEKVHSDSVRTEFSFFNSSDKSENVNERDNDLKSHRGENNPGKVIEKTSEEKSGRPVNKRSNCGWDLFHSDTNKTVSNDSTTCNQVDPNSYERSFGSDASKKNKFLRLMGHGTDVITEGTNCESSSRSTSNFSSRQLRVDSELEMQFMAGLKHNLGRRGGLGS